MRFAPKLIAIVGVLLTVAGCASRPGTLMGVDTKAGCAALVTGIEAEKIGLPTRGARIESATLVAPGAMSVAERGPTPAATITPATPEYCKLLGSIASIDPNAPPIRFQINLPTQWNARSVQYGGGGFNGVLITGLGLLPAASYDQPSPLALGFATYGTDSGHQTAAGQPPQAFALNDEAFVNFAHAAYKKVRDVAVETMKLAYARKPLRMYFVGSSEGGREGLVMAQRYPKDFDGIFARVPVLNWTLLQFAGTRNGAVTFGDAWLPPAKVKLVHDAVLAACDAADGLADGLVSDFVGCKKRFDLERLRCGTGITSATDNCLTEPQLRAVQTLQSPYRAPFPLANGVTEYPGYPLGGEDIPAAGPTGGWRAWWLGGAAPSLPAQPNNGIAWVYGSGAVQYVYARNPQVDPRSVDLDKLAARVREVSALMDATNPDLADFVANDGKLILLENMADYAQSPYAGIRYHATLVEQLGPDRVNQAVRLFTAPGIDHVGTGGPGLVDMLPALVNWVEQGVPPQDLVLAEQNAKPPFAVSRTRPLCEWPRWPRYRGGDPNAAGSFECIR
jgi:Tannase and feruloyl esterase